MTTAPFLAWSRGSVYYTIRPQNEGGALLTAMGPGFTLRIFGIEWSSAEAFRWAGMSEEGRTTEAEAALSTRSG